MIWWLIDRLRYPACGRVQCGNQKNGKCKKLDLKEYLDCKKALRGWGRYA